MMFNKTKADIAFDTVIGETTKVSGNLTFRGFLRVDGIVDGDITLIDNKSGSKNHLLIGQKGSIKGTVHAGNITVSGSIIGDVHAHNKLVLVSVATVEGDVYYKQLSMDMGTQFSGKLEPKYAAGHEVEGEVILSSTIANHGQASKETQTEDSFALQDSVNQQTDDESQADNTMGSHKAHGADNNKKNKKQKT